MRECAIVSGYVVVAEFLVRSEHVEAFASLIGRHASLSRNEPGCEAFEVSQDTLDDRRFLLYERYRDAAAYEAHRLAAYYARFRKDAPAMLILSDDEIFHRRSVLRSIV
jgi:(4S)-4-hydroxy-5-phosphonooxypentane-2,3-dione isomerase